MTERQGLRTRQRFVCEIRDGQERHEGVVMDLSSSGLFVMSAAAPPCGTELSVVIPATDDSPDMTLRAEVVRHRLVSVDSQLVPRGIGLRILAAPIEYQDLARDEAKALGSDPTSDELLDMAQAVVDVLIEVGAPLSRRELVERSGIPEAAWPRVLGVLIQLDQARRVKHADGVRYSLARS